MANSVEIEAKNVDQAVKKACDQYNIAENKLRYEVISYGSTGIFGLGKTRKARIRIRLTDSKPQNGNAGAPTNSEPSQRHEDVQNDVRALIDETLNGTSINDPLQAPVRKGEEVIKRIIDEITDGAKINILKQNDRVVYQVNGGNSALLIGKHGQTLEAIHTIVEKVVNKHHEGHVRVQIDIAGYMENRKQNLRKQAERLAEKCKRLGKPVTLGLMNAHDRRVVHLALKNDTAVRTQSVGEGFLRKLMIYPKRSGLGRSRRN